MRLASDTPKPPFAQRLLRAALAAACLLLFGLHARAAEPYQPKREVSIEEPWRWTKLEDVSGLGIRDAVHGPNEDVWFISRDRVIRYDGVSTESFSLENGADAPISTLHVDASGQVYALSGGRLRTLLDGQWTTLFESDSERRQASNIAQGPDGALWFPDDGKLHRHLDGATVSFPVSLASPFSAVVDSKGKLWVSDRVTGSIAVYDTRAIRGSELPLFRHFENPGHRRAFRLVLDSSDRVWLLDFSGAEYSYRFDNYVNERIQEIPYGFVIRPTALVESSPGKFWFGSSFSLIEIGENAQKSYSGRDYPVPLPIAFLLSLPGDRLLVGGKDSNIYTIDLSPDRWATYHELNFQCEGKDGLHWFIHHDGRAISHDPASDAWTAFDPRDGIIDTPNKITAASDGQIWASGSHQGAAAFSRLANGRWTSSEFPEVGVIFSHLAAIETKDGAMYFGNGTAEPRLEGPRGGAVKVANGQAEIIHPNPFPVRIANIAEAEDGGFWIGGGELLRIGPTGIQKTIANPEPGRNWVDQILIDPDGSLWAAIRSLGLYQRVGDRWIEHSSDHALGSAEIAHLLPGPGGNGIRALSEKGLSYYDGRSWSQWTFLNDIRFLPEEHTMQSTADGSLWVNYAYRNWLLNGRRPPQRLSWFRSVRYQGNASGPQTILHEQARKLPEGSRLSFEWTGADAWSQTPASQLDYSWRLGGGDWSPYSRQNRVALDNIGSGDYVFEVRSRDHDLNVDATPARIVLNIFPPLWKRPWFILSTAAAFALIVALIVALLKARVQTAIKVERFKLDFYTNLSHELTNPLAAIVAPIESALRKELPRHLRLNLQIALRNAWKMKALVTQLLQFRKLELGLERFRPSHGELVSFVKDAVECHTPLWQEKNLSVSIEADPAYLKCAYDADKLQKIVDNLLSNAIKYTNPGGAIRIRLESYPNDGSPEARLVIEDEGIGIPQAEIERVFKPFYRVDSNLSKREGFGIGLALVNQLVTLCGGKIELASPIREDGTGTRVTVHLPLEDAEELPLEAEAPAPIEPLAESDAGEAARPKVLLVEDANDLRRFMREELSEKYEIYEAHNGKEGLQLAIDVDLDLVISDVMMPEMDGLELCRRLRADPRTSHIPIIMLTAKEAAEHRAEGAKAGADAYFAKPLNMLSLAAQIENVLGIRRALRRRFSEQLILEPTELTVTPADEAFLRKAIEIVEANIVDENFTVIQFARDMAMSQSGLCKTLKGLTGQTPSPFIRSMRLKRAAQLLRTGSLSVSETLEQVGIADLSYFSRIFKKEFGVTPSHYAEQEKDAHAPAGD